MSEKNKPAAWPDLDLLTRDECAEILRVTVRTFANLLSRGEIPFIQVSGAIRIRRAALVSYCNARETRLNPKRAEAVPGRPRRSTSAK